MPMTEKGLSFGLRFRFSRRFTGRATLTPCRSISALSMMETLPSIQTSNRPNLLVNGVEPKDWGNIIINELRTPSFRALPHEQTLDFSYVLGRFFQKPGVYTVGWQGEHFKASNITLRVLPRQQ